MESFTVVLTCSYSFGISLDIKNFLPGMLLQGSTTFIKWQKPASCTYRLQVSKSVLQKGKVAPHHAAFPFCHLPLHPCRCLTQVWCGSVHGCALGSHVTWVSTVTDIVGAVLAQHYTKVLKTFGSDAATFILQYIILLSVFFSRNQYLMSRLWVYRSIDPTVSIHPSLAHSALASFKSQPPAMWAFIFNV